MDRRQFVQGLFLFSAGGVADVLPAAARDSELAAIKFGLSMLQGFTDETTAQFAIDVPRNMKLHYEVREKHSGKKCLPYSVHAHKRRHSFWRVDHVLFDHLQVGYDYELFVLNEFNLAIDHREFKTLDTQKPSAKIALLSCMLDLNPHRGHMWQMVFETQPDILFFLGDNVYGDIMAIFDGPKLLWSRYLQTRSALPIYRAKKLIPTIAIWDDHDYGKNDVGGNYKYKHESLKTFHSFYAQEPIGTAYRRGPGVASSFTAFGKKFIFLDNRWWRGLGHKHADYGFLGEEQLNWFAGELNHQAAQTWVLQGSQFFGDFKKSSGTYESKSPDEFAHFLNLIRAHNKPTNFISGDVHFSEVTQLKNDILGHNSYEITSSCLHSFLHKSMPSRNNRVAGAIRENFIVVDTNVNQNDILLTCFGRGFKQRFSFEIAGL